MAIVPIRLSSVLFAILSFLVLVVSPICGLGEEGGAHEHEIGQNYTRDGRIVGGTAVISQDVHPYFVRLRVDNPANLLHCGGSLIGPDLVLSAAHCFHKKLIVGVNAYYLKNSNVPQSKEIQRKVERIIVHPEYKPATFENDVMILVLSQEVTGVQPIKLNQDEKIPRVGTDVKSVGLGSTDANDFIPAGYLQEVTLTTFSNSFCNSKTSYDGLVQEPIMFCAGFQKGRSSVPRDTCFGDSGGPSLQMIKNEPVQVGIVSWGVGCAEQSFPGVYADVAALYKWIEKTGCDHSKSKSSGHLSCHKGSTQAKTLDRKHINRSRKRRPSQTGGGSGGNTQRQRSGFRPDANYVRRRPGA